MNITIYNNLADVPSASAAAVVALLPTNTASVEGAGYTDRELDPSQADVLIIDLLRITGGGPIALLLTHNANDWSACLQKHGLTTATRAYYFGTIDVVIGSAGPTDLPADDVISLGSLVNAVTALVSKQGDSVVIPYAFDAVTTLAVGAMERHPIAVAASETHGNYLRAALAGEVTTQELTDEQYAEVRRRLSEGETTCRIARSMGIVGDRLCRRLEGDGLRPPRKRGNARAAAVCRE